MRGSTDAAGYSRSLPPFTMRHGQLAMFTGYNWPSAPTSGLASTLGWPFIGMHAAHTVAARIARKYAPVPPSEMPVR